MVAPLIWRFPSPGRQDEGEYHLSQSAGASDGRRTLSPRRATALVDGHQLSRSGDFRAFTGTSDGVYRWDPLGEHAPD